MIADAMKDSAGSVSLSISHIVAVLLGVSALLVAISAATRLAGLNIAFVDVDFEASIPTLWSVLIIAVLAVTLAARTTVARSAGERWTRWLVVTVCVLYVLVDEFIQIHEKFIIPVQDALDTGGLLYLAWIIPYSVVTLAIIAFLFPWLWSLDRPLRSGLILAGVIFVTGAVGMEAVGGLVLDDGSGGFSDSAYAWGEGPSVSPLFTVATSLEEGLEMLGVTIAIRTVLIDLVGDKGFRLGVSR